MFGCLYRVEEYITSGRDKCIVDPDANKIYSKRKARECSNAHQIKANDTQVKYPSSGWGKALEKLPLFTRAEMKKHIENSGKRIGNAEHHSVPTSLKRAKTFLQNAYLSVIV